MPASDVPGYVQGYRFTAANYAGGQFADLSGYGSPVTTVLGAPIFETVDGHEGILLDNTWHGQFWPPNTWQGTVVLVARMERLSSGTLFRYPIAFDRDGMSGNQGRLTAVFFGNDRRLQLVSLGGELAGPANLTDSTIGAVAFSQDQARRGSYDTRDGVTVDNSGPHPALNNGIENAMGSNSTGGFIGALRWNSATQTVETEAGIHLFELHFFEANPIVDAPTEMQAFLAELTSAYS